MARFVAALVGNRDGAPELNRQQTSLKIGTAVVLLCLMYLWLRPVSDNYVLVAVLLLMGSASAAVSLIAGRRFGGGFAPIWICQFLFALLGTIVGIVMATPGVWYEVLIYAAAPILYWTWVRALDLRAIRLVLLWLAIGTSALSTAIILFVAAEKGMLPHLVPGAILGASGAAFDPTTNQIRFFGLSTLAAAGPLWAASLFVRGDALLPHATWRVYAASSSVVAALVSGRRAIVVVIIIGPLIAWISLALIRWQWSRTGVSDRAKPKLWALRRIGVAVVATLVVLGLVEVAAPSLVRLSAIPRSFASAMALVGLGQSGVVDVRVAEAGALIDGWKKSPVIGSGFGAALPSFVRDRQKPWSYELQYHLLLFQTGLAGALLAIVALLAGLKQLRAAARAKPAFAATLGVTSAGAISLLLANAIDPYLQAPGHMWAIYLPLAVTNSILVTKLATSPNGGIQAG